MIKETFVVFTHEFIFYILYMSVAILYLRPPACCRLFVVGYWVPQWPG